MFVNGNIILPGTVIVGKLTPSAPGEVTSKQYVDSLIGAFLARSGDSMTGFLTLNADPTSPLHAATKQYVDSRVGGGLTTAGGTLTGYLTLHADPTAPMHAATKQYVDTKVSKAGDTMTGSLTLSGDPTSDLHAATKQYVDNISATDVDNLGTGFALYTGKLAGNFQFKTLVAGPNVTITPTSTELEISAEPGTGITVVAGTNIDIDVVGSEYTINNIGPDTFLELTDTPNAYSADSLIRSGSTDLQFSSKTKLSSDDNLYGHRELLVVSTVDVTPTADDSNKVYVLDSLVNRQIVLNATTLSVGHVNKFITANSGDWVISSSDTVVGENRTHGTTDELQVRLISKAPNIWQSILSDVSTDRTNVFKKANATVPVKATVTGTITPDFSQSNIFQYLVTGDLTINEPINTIDGQVIRLRIQQDATGGHNVTLPTSFKFSDPHSPSSAANSVDLYTFTYFADYNRYECIIVKGLA